jgi:hypothetical protein
MEWSDISRGIETVVLRRDAAQGNKVSPEMGTNRGISRPSSGSVPAYMNAACAAPNAPGFDARSDDRLKGKIADHRFFSVAAGRGAILFPEPACPLPKNSRP